MSINLGIYDFFAYIIPGMLYLYVFDEFLRSVGMKYVDTAAWLQPGQAPNIFLAIPVLIAAYVAGHIVDPLAYRFYLKFLYSLRHKKKVSEKQLQYLKDRCLTLDIKFEPQDWNVLFTFLRERNVDITRVIDKYQADSMMLRNIAFGTLLLTFIYLGKFFFTGQWTFLFTGLGVFVVSFLSINKSNQFREWFYASIFEASLGYGTDLRGVTEYTVKKSESQPVGRKSVRK